MSMFRSLTRHTSGLALLLILVLALSACAAGSPATVPDAPAASQNPNGQVPVAADGSATTSGSGDLASVPLVAGDPAAVTVGKTADGYWFRGDPQAPITLIEYSDFQCPFCERHFTETAPQLETQYVQSGLVRHIFKDFPLNSIHPQAEKAAEAARCAGDQNKFWEMHDRLFGSQQDWAGKADAPTLFKTYAGDLSLDQKAFDSCLDSDQYAQAITQSESEGLAQGVQGTPAFFVNDWFISGAQPLSVFQDALEKAQAGTHPAPTPTPLPAGVDPFTADPANPGRTYSGNYYRGDANAPITMIEFSDYQCPFCLQHFTQTEPQIDAEWVKLGKVRVVFENFPLNIHPQAPKAAEAAECAGVQGKFWEMHDALFTHQAEWAGQANASDFFKTYAKTLALDSAQFDQCLDSGSMAARVQAGLELGQQAQVRGTPNFFLVKAGSGIRIPGALPYDQFKAALTQVMDGAAAGPAPAATPGS